MPTKHQARRRVGAKLLVVHCHEEMKAAVDRAAERDMVSASAYVRRAIRDRLQADSRFNESSSA